VNAAEGWIERRAWKREAIAQSVANTIEATPYGHRRPSRKDIARPMGCTVDKNAAEMKKDGELCRRSRLRQVLPDSGTVLLSVI
jgi:hypothetical protein